MKLKSIHLTTLVLGSFGIIIGILFKIQHWEGAGMLLIIGFAFALIYTFIGIRILYASGKSLFEKSFWLLRFLFMNLLTGLVFYFNTIRRTS